MKKRYVWLKLQKDFFQDKAIKKLRRIAGGDTYTVIYLKMLLLSVRNEGKIFFENIESSFSEELALDLDESIENVDVTLNFLTKYKLISFDSQDYVLDYALNNIGSECESAERVRRHREKIKKLQCNGQTLPCNDKTLQGNDKTLQVTFCNDIKRREDTEKEKSKNLKDSFKNESININKQISDINKQISDFFEEIWELYPCKKGKSRISQSNKKSLYKIGLDEMKRAIERYKSDPELKSNNGYKNYQNGSTFFKKTYIEFLDVNYKEKENENKNENHFYKNESREIDTPCFD